MSDSLAMFTVDVETDWCGDQVRGIQEALPKLIELLESSSATATFFVVANLSHLLTDCLPPSGPHEVASHGLTHQLLTRLSPPEIEREVIESKRILESQGHQVDGFRAPFFQAPAELSSHLAGAGYTYDASRGSVWPQPWQPFRASSNHQTTQGLPRVSTSWLRDGMTPFSLTYLRLYSPFGVRLISPRARLFYCHLHELVDDSEGWQQLAFPLRHLHQRNSGSNAWLILQQLFERFKFVSCRDFLQHMPPQLQAKTN